MSEQKPLTNEDKYFLHAEYMLLSGIPDMIVCKCEHCAILPPQQRPVPIAKALLSALVNHVYAMHRADADRTGDSIVRAHENARTMLDKLFMEDGEDDPKSAPLG